MPPGPDNNHSHNPDSIKSLIDQVLSLCLDESERAVELGGQAVSIAVQSGLSDLVARAQTALARAYMYNGRFRESMDLALRTVNASKNQAPELYADAMGTLAHVYDVLGNYQDALKTRMEQLKIVNEIDDRLGVADVLHSIGVAYARMDDHTASLERYEQAYALKQELDAPAESIAKTLNNMGLANRNLRNLEASLAAHEKSVEILERNQSRFLAAAARGNLARAQEEAGDVESAVANFELAMETMEDTSNLYFVSELSRDYAELELRQGRVEHARDLCETALKVAYQTGAKPEIFRAHKLLVTIYENLEDYPRSLHHMRRFHAVEKEVHSEESEAQIHNLRLVHELERKEQENKIYRLKNVELASALTKAEKLQGLLEKQSLEDQLTGLYNRRYLNHHLQLEFERAIRHQQPLSLVLCDIDHFKRVNDRFSHAMGDEVLRAVGSLLRSNIRQEDIAARFGGEEFVLLLPQTSGQQATTVCEHIRQAIESHAWSVLTPGLSVTMSFGISDLISLNDHEAMLHDADMRLYEAKKNGRNQVCFANP